MKILLIDIETAPNKVYAWGLFNQDIYLDQIEEVGYTLCWTAKWLGSDEAFFASLRNGNKPMLRKAYDLLNDADAVVHYNGAKFDIPVLNQEFVKVGFSPTVPAKQIDLLQVVKKNFRLPSNKLEFVAKYFGISRKLNNRGMKLWKGCMEGDDKAWEDMEKYNRQDVVVLEDLYTLTLPYINNHPNHALFTNSNSFLCTNCGSHHLVKRGFAHTRTMTYQRYQCGDCGTWLRSRVTTLDREKKSSVLIQDKR